jgi:AraC-like DNA-binding protein
VALVRTHPPTAASRAARLIRMHYDERWSVDRLARGLHMTPSHLRVEFQREYGMPVHQYREHVRVREAAMKIRTEKVDAHALRVGYRSRKNLYAAFRRVTGMSLTTFRRLPEDRALQFSNQSAVGQSRMTQLPIADESSGHHVRNRMFQATVHNSGSDKFGGSLLLRLDSNQQPSG